MTGVQTCALPIYPGLLTSIKEKKTIDDALKAQMDTVLAEFKGRFGK